MQFNCIEIIFMQAFFSFHYDAGATKICFAKIIKQQKSGIRGIYTFYLGIRIIGKVLTGKFLL